MKVFVVLRYENEWQTLIGVYSNRATAEEVANSVTTYYNGSSHVPLDVGHVEEVELDKKP
jgi:hypothetical protein